MADKKQIIDIPPFPPLRGEEFFWEGEVSLPSWSGFQMPANPWSGPRKRPEGVAELSVKPHEGKAGTPPTKEQIAAYRHLLEKESAIAANVANALLQAYPTQRQQYLEGYDLEECEQLPVEMSLDGLRPIVELIRVHVIDLARDNFACIGFEFNCFWDEEHGAGVMTHRGKVIAVGDGPTSFMEWKAERGLKGK